jgi:hypothetical protein
VYLYLLLCFLLPDWKLAGWDPGEPQGGNTHNFLLLGNLSLEKFIDMVGSYHIYHSYLMCDAESRLESIQIFPSHVDFAVFWKQIAFIGTAINIRAMTNYWQRNPIIYLRIFSKKINFL